MTSLHPPRHLQRTAPLRIALIESALDDGSSDSDHSETGRRLAGLGHAVTLYGSGSETDDGAARRVELPDLPIGRLRTSSGLALAAAHVIAGPRQDVVMVFGTANARFIPLLRTGGAAVLLHVDGVGREHEHRSGRKRRTLRRAEQIAARQADALVTDGRSTARYYEDEFGVLAEVIRPAASLLRNVPADALERLGAVPGAFHLLRATDWEDHFEVALEGYHRSAAALPLLVTEPTGLTSRGAETLRTLMARDHRIRLLDDLLDARVHEQLAFHAAASMHSDLLGRRPKSLLQAMSAGTAAIAWDTASNREVAGTAGSYFSTPAQLAYELEQVERYPFRFRDIGELMQERVRVRHDPDATAEAYSALAAKLSRGWSTRGMTAGRRLMRADAPVP